MKTTSISRRGGFTLVELTIAILMGMVISTLVLALFNTQLTFLRIYQAQNFLTEEAPLTSMYVSRLVGKADRFRLHNTVADALAGINPQLTASPVVVLNFRQPDGTVRASILSFENKGSGNALYYYVVPTSGLLGTPQWYITKKASNVQFAVVNGILQITLTGPNSEQITYSGVTQQ